MNEYPEDTHALLLLVNDNRNSSCDRVKTGFVFGTFTDRQQGKEM